jgi:hypothetical protein
MFVNDARIEHLFQDELANGFPKEGCDISDYPIGLRKYEIMRRHHYIWIQLNCGFN